MKSSSRSATIAVVIVLLTLIVVAIAMSSNKDTHTTDAQPATNTLNTKTDENATSDSPTTDSTTTTKSTTTPDTSTTTDTTTTTPQKVAVITYVNNAFSPSVVTIASGGSVTFTNADTKSINIASDPHPSHTEYPALNLGLLSTGKTSESVSFSKAGTYSYHNHINATQAGTIIVK